MATLACANCGREVTTTLILCPDCAAPVGYSSLEQTRAEVKSARLFADDEERSNSYFPLADSASISTPGDIEYELLMPVASGLVKIFGVYATDFVVVVLVVLGSVAFAESFGSHYSPIKHAVTVFGAALLAPLSIVAFLSVYGKRPGGHRLILALWGYCLSSIFLVGLAEGP